MKNELNQVSIFYKNDQIGGIGQGFNLIQSGYSSELQKAIEEASQSSINYYRGLTDPIEKEELIIDVQMQLEYFADWFTQYNKNPTKYKYNDWKKNWIFSLDIITFLIDIGVLVDDEYTGVVWVYCGASK